MAEALVKSEAVEKVPRTAVSNEVVWDRMVQGVLFGDIAGSGPVGS